MTRASEKVVQDWTLLIVAAISMGPGSVTDDRKVCADITIGLPQSDEATHFLKKNGQSCLWAKSSVKHTLLSSREKDQWFMLG